MLRTPRLASFVVSLCALAAWAGEPEVTPAAAAPVPATPAPAGPDADAPVVMEGVEITAPRLVWQEPVIPSTTTGVDVGETLQHSGQTQKVRKGGYASDVVVRGFQKDNLAVTVDDGRLFGACPNRMDPPVSHLDAAEVEQVEVRRGPFDVTSPGALGGSVHVHTRAARPGVHGTLETRYGRFNDVRTMATLAYGGEQWEGLFGGSFRRADPYLAAGGQAITDLYDLASTNRYRAEATNGTAYNVGTLWAKVGLSPWDGQRAEVSYSRSMLRDVLYPFLLMDAIVDDTDRAGITYELERLGALRDGRVNVHWSRVFHDMSDVRRCSSSATPGTCLGSLPEPWSMRSVATAHTGGAKAEATLGDRESDALGTTLLGMDFDLRSWDVATTRLRRMPTMSYFTEASVPDVRTLRGGLYAEHHRRLTRHLRLTAAARFDLSSSSAAIDRTEYYALFYPEAELALARTDVLPAGNVRLEYLFDQPLTLFAGIGHAARAPDPQERFFALTGMMNRPGRVGRPGLAPSRNTEVDIGAEYGTDTLRLNGQAFYGWISDYVVPTAAMASGMVTASSYQNVSAVMYGAEAFGSLSLPGGFSSRAGLTWTRGRDLTRDDNLPEIPPLQLNAAVRWQRGGFFVEAEEVYAMRQYLVAASIHEEATPAWYITNLTAGMRYERLSFTAGVRNLFNLRYYEHLSYQRDPFSSGIRVPEPGRTVYVSAQYEL